MLAQLVLQLRIGEAVVALDLFDRAIDFLVAHRQLQFGGLLGQQLVVNQAIEDFAPNRAGSGVALAGVCDGSDFGQKRCRAIFDLALQDHVVADQRRNLLDHACRGGVRQEKDEQAEGKTA